MDVDTPLPSDVEYASPPFLFVRPMLLTRPSAFCARPFAPSGLLNGAECVLNTTQASPSELCDEILGLSGEAEPDWMRFAVTRLFAGIRHAPGVANPCV